MFIYASYSFISESNRGIIVRQYLPFYGYIIIFYDHFYDVFVDGCTTSVAVFAQIHIPQVQIT